MPERNTGDRRTPHTPIRSFGEGNGHRKRAAARDMDTHIHTRLLWRLCVVPAVRALSRGAHLQAVLYIRLNKAPPFAVQQRRLIARSLDEVRTKGSIQSSHLPRCHVGQSDTGARRSPLLLGAGIRPLSLFHPAALVDAAGRGGGPPAVPTVYCLFCVSDGFLVRSLLLPRRPMSWSHALVSMFGLGEFRLKLRIVLVQLSIIRHPSMSPPCPPVLPCFEDCRKCSVCMRVCVLRK